VIGLLPTLRLPRWLTKPSDRRSTVPAPPTPPAPVPTLHEPPSPPEWVQACEPEDEPAVLPALTLPWQAQPARQRPPTPDHSHLLLRLIRRCWNCGHVGVSFCPTACDPSPVRAPGPWVPATPLAYEPPTAAEVAQDAHIAAVLDEEAA
jgi:hypothetical protein